MPDWQIYDEPQVGGDKMEKLSRFYENSSLACNGEKDYNVEQYGSPCGCGGSLEAIDPKLIELIDDIAETCRANFGSIPAINCCWRCDVHNERVGGKAGINHNAVPCIAVDLDAGDIGVERLAVIAEELGADGVGRYFGEAGNFVHADVREGRTSGAWRW
jgi:hypothetical protein